MSRNGRAVGMVYPSLGHVPTQDRATEYGHPAHRGFAAAVGADDVVVQFRSIPGPIRETLLTDVYSAFAASIPPRDVYVTENDAVLYSAPFIERRYPDSTLIHLAASDRLLGYAFSPRPDDTALEAARRRVNRYLDTALLQRVLVRYCDGVIAVSEFARERLRAFVPAGVPVRVAHPYIQPAAYATLESVEPDLDADVAVMVGEWRDHKGVDLLVEAWSLVRERHPNAELRLVGRRFPGEYADVPGVTLRGFVESLETEFAAASLCVHPARIEAFGVCVVEAMRAGLPTVVTSTVGARSAVEEVDESLVVAPTAEALATRVSGYFATSLPQRKSLSRASRAASEPFDETTKTRQFRAAFDALVAGEASVTASP